MRVEFKDKTDLYNLIDWLYENIGPLESKEWRWELKPTPFNNFIYIKNKKHVTAFLLRWGGK